MKNLFLVFCIVLILTPGCNSTGKERSSATVEPYNKSVAEGFLMDMDLKVISYEGNVETYVLEKWKLTTNPYSQIWGLQRRDPAQFIGKSVGVEKFIVTNHPLDRWKSSSKTEKALMSKGRTIVWVIVIDKNAIGGYSLPDVGEVLVGGVYSIDGKVLEEVQKMSYKEWSERWQSRFAQELIPPKEERMIDRNNK